jgi:hypothetical protein
MASMGKEAPIRRRWLQFGVRTMLLLVTAVALLLAWELTSPETIKVGQDIGDVRRILTDHDIEYGENDLQMVMVDQDYAYLSFVLVRSTTPDDHFDWSKRAIVGYSKSGRTVVQILIEVRTGRYMWDGDRDSSLVQGVTLGRRGSYSVQLLPAEDQEPINRFRTKNEL